MTSEEFSTFQNCAEGSLLDQKEFSQPIITIYVIVFFISVLGFFLNINFFKSNLGNSFTLIIICTHRNMRTTTNFFLTNLAAADLLVATFCILQNAIHIFGTPNGHWPFGIRILNSLILIIFLGDLMCKLYVTILHSAPCTSIGILICVSLEKYIAVLHPLLSNKILTTQLRIAMTVIIWLLAWGSNLPHFLSAKVLNFGKIAACSRGFNFQLFFFSVSTRTFLTVNFVLWYVIPLVTIAAIYAQIGKVLWYSSRTTSVRLSNDSTNTMALCMHLVLKSEKDNNFLKNKKVSKASSFPPNILGTHITTPGSAITNNINSIEESESHGLTDNSEVRKKAKNKKVIRLLIAIVCSFAFLTLPNHARLLYSVWSEAYLCNSTWVALLQPLAYLSLFLSSGINPILYAFISQKFRSAVKDILNCRTSKLHRKWTRTRTLFSEIPTESRLQPRNLTRVNNVMSNSSSNLSAILTRGVSRTGDSYFSTVHSSIAQSHQGKLLR